jgi:hypothetical protein
MSSNDSASKIPAAFHDLMLLLFGEIPKDLCNRYVSRNHYMNAQKTVEKKYNLVAGSPEYLEWILTLVGRSPHFPDENNKQNLAKVPHQYRAISWQQFEEMLKEQTFVKKYGRTVLYILDSLFYWKAIQRRFDFLVYASIVRQEPSVAFLWPREQGGLETDATFTLIEMDLSKLIQPAKHVLIEELFRQWVRGIVEDLPKFDDQGDYMFFTAPYFSSVVYDQHQTQGQVWLEQLTNDLCYEPLHELKNEIKARIT